MSTRMQPKILTDNEQNFFKFLNNLDDLNLSFERFKKKMFALDENLINNNNIQYRMPNYYSWFKLEHVQKVFKRKKKELTRGIQKMPDRKDWNIHCYRFRNYVENEYLSIQTMNVDDDDQIMDLIDRFTKTMNLNPKIYWKMRTDQDGKLWIIEEVREEMSKLPPMTQQSETPPQTPVQRGSAQKTPPHTPVPPGPSQKTSPQTLPGPLKKSTPVQPGPSQKTPLQLPVPQDPSQKIQPQLCPKEKVYDGIHAKQPHEL